MKHGLKTVTLFTDGIHLAKFTYLQVSVASNRKTLSLNLNRANIDIIGIAFAYGRIKLQVLPLEPEYLIY
jgi:hypothetical protein